MQNFMKTSCLRGERRFRNSQSSAAPNASKSSGSAFPGHAAEIESHSVGMSKGLSSTRSVEQSRIVDRNPLIPR